MCGITGYFSHKLNFNPTFFAKANNIIRHRGPDDFGFLTINKNYQTQSWIDENLHDFNAENIIGAMGFRRLSIIDLSASGHQPMCDYTGNYWIVFNGEIYNYIEIRKELETKGYTFNSNTDTEVILNAYREWGTKCLSKFNGMWAYCIYDKQKQKLFCARDRVGIKPFYYTLNNDSFAFSSEIKQLLEMLPNKLNNLNDRLAFDFLVLGSYGNESEETYFKDVYKLSPGTYVELDLRAKSWSINENNWWNLPEVKPDSFFKESEVFETIYDLLQDSVKLRLRSDVPVGTALSGGLDSSGIVSIINTLNSGNAEQNKVFTISTQDTDIKDPYFSNLLINELPVKSYRKDFEDIADLNDLAQFTWHQEEPLQNTSILGSWQVYKFMKEMGITVALDGQGADEFMAGYHKWPFRKYLLDLYKTNNFHNIIAQSKKISSTYNVSITSILKTVLLASTINFAKQFPQTFYHQKLKNITPFFNPEFIQRHSKESYLINKNFNHSDLNFKSNLKKESYELIKYTNLPGILRQVDRNSMAFSVESRLPFLDYRLMEYLFSLPPSYMFRDGYTKYAYRMAMNKHMHQEIVWRKNKEGFKMPEYSILKNNKKFLHENIDMLLNDSIVNLKYTNKTVDYLLENKNNYNNVIWRIICFSQWKNTFNM